MSSIEEDEGRDALARVLRRAGRRTPPPPEVTEAVHVATLLAWQQIVRRRRRRMRFALAAAAGLAALLVSATWWTLRAPAPALVAASVVRVQGSGAGLGPGARVMLGERLRIPANDGLVLALPDGVTLRVAGPAVLHLDRMDGARLDSGRLYFESDDVKFSSRYAIRTPLARIVHVGTRFGVEVGEGESRVQVRSGAVSIESPAGSRIVRSGYEAALHAGGGSMKLSRISTHGPSWSWADALAGPIVLDGRSLAEVLEQIARESGRTLEYASDAVRDLCLRTRMHGPALELGADDALGAVLTTTGMVAVTDGERILVRARAEE